MYRTLPVRAPALFFCRHLRHHDLHHQYRYTFLVVKGDRRPHSPASALLSCSPSLCRQEEGLSRRRPKTVCSGGTRAEFGMDCLVKTYLTHRHVESDHYQQHQYPNDPDHRHHHHQHHHHCPCHHHHPYRIAIIHASITMIVYLS